MILKPHHPAIRTGEILNPRWRTAWRLPTVSLAWPGRNSGHEGSDQAFFTSLTLAGSAGFERGPHGYGLVGGTSQSAANYAVEPNTDNYLGGLSSLVLSFALCIKPAASSQVINAKRNAAGNGYTWLILVDNTNKVGSAVNNVSNTAYGCNSPIALVPGRLHTITLAWSGTANVVRLYQDGDIVAETATTGATLYNTSRRDIYLAGWDVSALTFLGWLYDAHIWADDVSAFSRAGEIAQLRAADPFGYMRTGPTVFALGSPASVPTTPLLTSPADGGTFSGATLSIEYTASTDPVGGTNTYTARYSPAGAGTWTTIFSGRSGTSPYSWDISAIPSAEYDVEIFAVNSGGTGGTSESDQHTITLDQTPSTPAITAPLDGASLTDFLTTVSYTGSTDPLGGAVTYTLRYRPAAGGAWTSLFTGRSGTANYTWDLEGIADGSYQLQLYATATDTSLDSDPDTITVSLSGFVLETPDISIGGLDDDRVTVSTVANSDYLSVTFYLLNSGGSELDSVTKTGSDRFSHEFTGLTAATDYTVYLVVEYAEGSVASIEVDFTTLAVPISNTLGCPPVPQTYAWNPDSNPGDYDTWRGTGWYTPYPGQPLRGTVQCRFRYPSSGTIDVDISDDAGATWTSLETDIPNETGEDGDGLKVWFVDLVTTGYTDGQDYRLRATIGSVVIESLTFLIDNDGAAYSWAIRDGNPGARFATQWGLTQVSNNFGTEGARIWYRHTDSEAILGYLGSPWSAYVDTEVPVTSRGADCTLRIWMWSGEGGFAQAQGGLDLEGWRCGIGFFVNGEDEATTISRDDGIGQNQTGIFVGLGTDLTQYYGCCDEYYTSSTARFLALGRATTGETFSAMTNESAGLSNDMATIARWYGKSYHRYPRFIPSNLRYAMVAQRMRARLGATPGDTIEERGTCGRLYNMYTVRARVETDPSNQSRVRVRARLDGPGVIEPVSGYWHYDEWHDAGNDWQSGSIAIVGRHFARSLYGTFGGSRLYTSWSALPLEPETPPEIIPEEPPTTTLPTEGEPCTLILQVYEADGESIAWEVGSDRDHARPYLMEPSSYGEQELDVIAGAASIGQVEVAVIDRQQIQGDQDSGYVTQRLVEGGLGAIHGRRCKLIRYVDWDIPPVVIADGPAGTPRMDDSYAAYRWTIRDTRETERRKQAFTAGVPNTDTWILPQGNPNGWGKEPLTPGGAVFDWLIFPTDPLTGTYTEEVFDPGLLVPAGQTRGRVDLSAYTPGSAIDPEVIVTDAIRDKLIGTPEFVTFPVPLSYAGEWVKFTWPDIEVLWRYPGDTDDDWRVHSPVEYMPRDTYDAIKAQDSGYAHSLIEYIQGGDPYLVDGTYNVPGFADYVTIMNNVDQPITPGEFPSDGETIEFAIRYIGTPSADIPKLIEFDADGNQYTLGTWLRDLYDGVHSVRDATTGEPIPTGIRYVEADLLQLTQPVRIYLTEPIKDIRDAAEKYGYGPTGWVPALDRELYISPVSQIPPQDEDVTLIDNAVTEPSPNWNGGETIVNILTFSYPRYYVRTDEDRYFTYAGLEKRDIELQARSEQSIGFHSEQEVEYDGSWFVAFGASLDGQQGVPLAELEDEDAYQLWEDRRAYVLDRYEYGAQIIVVPVKRSRTYALRAGDWVVVDLSWLPDYVTQRRDAAWLGQVIAIRDLDCAWRELVIEESLPVDVS